MKAKTCRVCKKKFTPTRAIQPVCSESACMYAYANEAATKAKRKRLEQQGQQERKALRERKDAIKTRSEYMSEAQTAFNSWIRWRDRDLPCICCGKVADESWKPGGSWDAGHFLGRGAYPELRFIEDNVHKQLKSCNAGSAKYAMKGKTVAQSYRVRLIEKIGLDRVEFLEGPHEPKKYTIPELKAIRDEYRGRLREAKKEDDRG